MLLKGEIKVFKISRVRNAAILAMFLIQSTSGLGLRSLQAESRRERVLIRAGDAKAAVRTAIESLGGEITHEFKHLDLIAAEVPAAALFSVQALAGDDSISKNAPIPFPDTVFPFPGRGMDTPQGNPLANIPAAGFEQIGDSSDIADFAQNNPGSYRINHTNTNVRALHEMGFTGQDVIVAVIDSGLRPGFGHMANGTVVGCEDMLRGRGRNRCSDDLNFGHGTFVSGLIASNAIVSFEEGSLFLESVTLNAPDAVLEPDNSAG
jgi:subtilisin family serine protease